MEELINEMSYDLAECHVDYLDDAKLWTDYDTMAQKMVSRGYRKQSEVAREIFEEIENLFAVENFRLICNRQAFAELKKKYTEDHHA